MARRPVLTDPLRSTPSHPSGSCANDRLLSPEKGRRIPTIFRSLGRLDMARRPVLTDPLRSTPSHP
ncbi:hypothetical protein, partial [Okeania hirsuta]|uniref:hypothetical protein n=1 Tax=Okeania hirsuta TaxID=1458930 RepID=UPI001961CFD9